MFKPYQEAANCMLCKNPACTNACSKNFNPARMLRAVRFDNINAASSFIDKTSCISCEGDCQNACIHYDRPIRIKSIIEQLPPETKINDISLETQFLGLKCENPFFLSSSIVASSYEMVARAFNMGWAGVVYKTIGFIKPKEVSPRFDAVSKENTPFIGFKNLEQISDVDLQENLKILHKLKQNYPSKIIVASIMGQNLDEWASLSKLVTEAGVDIIECNFSCPHMKGDGLGSDVGQNPELVSKYTSAVCNNTHLPVLAKMTPNIGNMEIPAIAAVNAGAKGIAAINTIKSISGLDIKTFEPKMSVNGKSSVSGYSGKAIKPIALRFINDIAQCNELKNIPISGMGGIETWSDAVEFILLGCSNVQITTAVMQYGYRIIDDLIDGLKRFMSENNIKSVNNLVGKALNNIVPTENLDRNSIVYPKFNLNKCVGCGRCEISCYDAGHSALTVKDNKPVLNAKKCVGCHLCTLVCPVNAINISQRILKV